MGEITGMTVSIILGSWKGYETTLTPICPSSSLSSPSFPYSARWTYLRHSGSSNETAKFKTMETRCTRRDRDWLSMEQENNELGKDNNWPQSVEQFCKEGKCERAAMRTRSAAQWNCRADDESTASAETLDRPLRTHRSRREETDCSLLVLPS